MPLSLNLKIALGVYIFLILSIPAGAYLVSRQQIFKTSASQPPPVSKLTQESTPSSSLSALDEIKQFSQTAVPPSTPLPVSTPSPTVSFGPTLNFKLVLEGRPVSNQAARVFVGIAEGNTTSNPQYLLSFTVDLEANGFFSGLSLAGLTAGNQYTAVIKGPAQIASATDFIMSPSVSNLNNSEPITLLSGDLNEDNTINAADYAIAKAAYNTTPASSNWNANIDLNKDDIVNNIDLAYILKNFGKSGDSGIWVSTTPQVATPSGSLSPGGSATATPSGSPQLPVVNPDGRQGYWMWIPK